MSEPFWLDYDKLLAVARTLRNHGDQIQSEICEVLVGPSRLKELESLKYADYLHSPEWQFKQTQKLQDATHHCELCRSPDKLQVHHTTYDRRGCERFTDLIVLCAQCHAKFHDKLKDVEPNIKKKRAASAVGP